MSVTSAEDCSRRISSTTPQDRRRAAVEAGRGLRRVAHERRERGRVDALARDVAEQHHRAVADLEEVVEVAADGVAAARGAVGGRRAKARELGQAARQQAVLQRLGGARLLAEEARVLDGRARAQREVLDEREVARRAARARCRTSRAR